MNWMQLPMYAAALNTQIPATAGLIICRKTDYSYWATATIMFEKLTRHVTNLDFRSCMIMMTLHFMSLTSACRNIRVECP